MAVVLGPLLGEVVKNMKDKRDGTLSAQQKVFMYSAVSNITWPTSYTDWTPEQCSRSKKSIKSNFWK